MTTGQKGIDLIKSFESWFAKPYLDPVGVPTIGWGTIMYPSGKRVTMKDPAITREQGEEYFRWEVKQKETAVSSLVKSRINQNQFDALVSFTYNLGVGNLAKSTLLKKVNRDPKDETIRAEFAKWKNADGKPLKGLIRRRAAEADLYFS